MSGLFDKFEQASAEFFGRDRDPSLPVYKGTFTNKEALHLAKEATKHPQDIVDVSDRTIVHGIDAIPLKSGNCRVVLHMGRIANASYLINTPRQVNLGVFPIEMYHKLKEMKLGGFVTTKNYFDESGTSPAVKSLQALRDLTEITGIDPLPVAQQKENSFMHRVGEKAVSNFARNGKRHWTNFRPILKTYTGYLYNGGTPYINAPSPNPRSEVTFSGGVPAAFVEDGVQPSMPHHPVSKPKVTAQNEITLHP